MIYLYNTLTRQKEPFTPIKKGKVSLYSCGPTVYDYPHIGNWYAFIRWDLLYRTLQLSGYNVTWVMNITDVGHLVSDADEGEDKLEKGARREGKSAWDVAEFYTDYYKTALRRLHFSQITYTPRATDYIREQITLVKELEKKGYAYRIADGVYFDTAKLHDYGKLAHLDKTSLLAGARVEYNQQKRNPTDFALWKFSPKHGKRDMEWDSPWGVGFPGWHLECSAMSMKFLGKTIDIHTGGIDHIPVHHTNEIAQSEAATNTQFVHYWLHSNFVKVNGKKMSKSLGNLLTLEDIEKKKIPLDAFRILVMESHYRTEAQFTWDVLTAANNRYHNWLAVADLRWQPYPTTQVNELDFADLLTAMQDDLDTPLLLQRLDAQFAAIEQTGVSAVDVPKFNRYLQQVEALTGISLQFDDVKPDIKALLQARTAARSNHDWVLSDKLRDKIRHQGFDINDTANGQRWIRLH